MTQRRGRQTRPRTVVTVTHRAALYEAVLATIAGELGPAVAPRTLADAVRMARQVLAHGRQ
jgi:hypothetical protein